MVFQIGDEFANGRWSATDDVDDGGDVDWIHEVNISKELESYLPSVAFAEMATASKEDSLHDFYKDHASFDYPYASLGIT